MTNKVRQILGSAIVEDLQKIDEMFEATDVFDVQDDQVLLMLSEQLFNRIEEYRK